MSDSPMWRYEFTSSTTTIIMRNKPRSRSAPPFSAHDFGLGWELREDGIETEDLCMDPADLAEFSTVKIFRDYHSRSMYWVNSDKVLKLFSYLIDVSIIVENMDLARTRLLVPHVLRYGRSGNCSYILMERISHTNLAVDMLQWGILLRSCTPSNRAKATRCLSAEDEWDSSEVINNTAVTPLVPGERE
ncbi:uncharacterized protein C8R40DRAFT_1168518 [Lentinula edodes]|uniref:uncharacterized protein n=1 Tax=Lentinula edodes TaxID=5353 RepID=UPI001E8E4A38|nr:uncharacterized protein C8R40DRAFT_1168518 [Lentinula edodes]KAH7877182.1 hypothetical protein C8R40DRAFT_1168518 [Lentinula edodes]